MPLVRLLFLMHINITPEDVDTLVKDALLKAGIGKAITEAVAKTFSGYNNPIDEKLKQYVGDVAGDLIRTKFDAQIKEAVAAHIEAKVTREIIDSVVNVSVDKMVRAAQESRY